MSQFIIEPELGGISLHLPRVSGTPALPQANREKLAFDGTDLLRISNNSGSVLVRRMGHLYLPLTPLITDVGTNNADTGEKTLHSLTLPANTLAQDGWFAKVTAFGDFGSAVGTKTVNLYFGASIVATNDITLSPVSLNWVIESWIMRTGASAEKTSALQIVGAALQSPIIVTPAEALNGAVEIKVTGINGSALQPANTVRSRFLSVEVFSR